MSVNESRPEVPTWLAAALVALVGAGAVYSILLGGHLFAPISGLLWLGSVCLSLFVIYLFWRFVLAVERIAEKL